MRPHRKYLLLATILLVGGSVGWTAWQGIRIRTAWFHNKVVKDLDNFFDMPCEVGRIEPLTFSSRAFNDIHVWLPDRREQTPVFSCKQAIWQFRKKDGEPANELDLSGGLINLGAEGWQLSDYSQVLQSGLGHDFDDLHIARVGLREFELAFRKGAFALRCRDASGNITFPQPKEGLARLVAYEFNGHRVTEGVQIDARFEPKKGVRMHEVYLELPEVPLDRMGLAVVEGGGVTHGTFAGRVEYRAGGEATDSEVWLRGRLNDADLSELTRGWSLGPISGRVSVTLDGARVAQSKITHVRGRGRIDGLTLQSLARLAGRETLSGSAQLTVQWADFALGHVNELALSGHVLDLSLAELLASFGEGTATGKLAVRVNGLRIADDRIESADIDISVLPPPDQAGTIDRAVLLGAAKSAAGFEWPDWLPQRMLPDKIEYVQAGVRLIVRDNQLRVLGTHGDKGDTILTVKALGQTFALVKEQPGSIDLTPWIAQALERARTYDPQKVRSWWEQHKSMKPSTSPQP